MYVYRIGKLGELVVEGDNNIMNKVTGTSLETFTVLELNPQTSKFYVGGVPSDVRVSNNSHLVLSEGKTPPAHCKSIITFYFCRKGEQVACFISKYVTHTHN